MSSVDKRVVEMQFDNKQFQTGVKQTTDSLTTLQTSLKMEGATKGLSSINDAAGKVNLSKVAEGVENIASKFSAMSAIAITALANITSKAVDAGLQLVKSLTVEPIADGFADYNEKLTSVQTIMNATGASLETVNGYFTELDTYADKTVYNLSDMTGAFAKFTNAGVDMDKSVPAIKGIANMVALAGQGAQAASIAMYNLSQSIAGGFLTTTDYKSLNLANVATKDWKNNMIEAAVAAGTLEKKAGDSYHIAGTKAGSAYTSAALFNEALSEGWATSDILLGVLGNYGDATTELGKKAQAAAQDVKSLPMMMDTLKASVGTGWTTTFETLFGNVEESKELFTGLTTVIQGVLDASANTRNNLLADWKTLGGRASLIEGVKNIWSAFQGVMAPIKDAFRDIFPPITAYNLLAITKAFERFTESLQPTGKQFNQIHRIATGVFSAFKLGVDIVSNVVRVIKNLIGINAEGKSVGILDFFAKIADFFTKLKAKADDGDALIKWFDRLQDRIQKPIQLLKDFGTMVKELFTGFKEDATAGIEGGLDRVQGRLVPIQEFLGKVLDLMGKLGQGIRDIWDRLAPLRTAIGEFFSNVAAKVKDAISNMDFNALLDIVNTGLFAGLVLIVKKFLSGGAEVNVDVGQGIFAKIRGIFDGLTETMKAMQTKLKSEALLKIAGAIAILTVSVVALSLIDSDKLAKALGAMTVMFVQLGTALKVLDKATQNTNAAKLGALAIALGLLAGAIVILTISVKILSTLDWEELGKGLAGVTVLLGTLSGAAAVISKNSKNLVTGGAGLILMASAIAILAISVKIFGEMDLESMLKGFAALGGIIVALGIFGKVASVNPASAIGLTLVAGAVLLLSEALKRMGEMSWEAIAKGLVGMAGSLLILAGAMYLMSAALPGAASLVIGAASILILAYALEKMGAMSWEAIAKSMVLLTGSLLLLAGAMYLMSAGLPGAAALIVMAAALAILAPVLVTLGSLSWENIGKGLAALAGVFLVLGVAALVLTPVIPMIVLLGAAILLLGAGALAAGLGMLAFATGLTALVAIGAAGAVTLTLLVTAMIELIPKAMAAVAEGIAAFADVIANSGPQFVGAMTTLLMSVLETINTVAPAIIDTLFNLIMKLVDTLAENVPKFVDKGYGMIVGILQGIAKNIPGIIKSATDIVVNFIDGIGKSLPRIIEAGINLVINFINGIADGIRNNTDKMNAAGANLADAIVQGMVKGITNGITVVKNAATNLAKGALNAAKSFLGINSPSKEFEFVGDWSAKGFAGGITRTADVAEKAAEDMGQSAMDALTKSMSNLGDIASNEINFTPTIRPVLDLTDVKKGSEQIDGLITPSKVSVGTSYSSASAISAERAATAASAAELETPVQVGDTINFTQNNTSPKALSQTEIYRQTKNGISTVKGALPV